MPTCAIPKGLSLQPSPCEVGVRAIPKELSPGSILCRIRSDVIGTKRPASRDRFEGAVRQTHHMREIERLPRQITNLSAHEVRTNLLFTMSNRTSGKPRSSPQTFIRMTFVSSLLDTSARSARLLRWFRVEIITVSGHSHMSLRRASWLSACSV